MTTIMNLLKSSLALAISLVATSSMANSLDQAQSIQNKTNNASASSQKVIDKSSQATLMLQAEIERLQEEVKNLEIYHDHLAALVESQNKEAQSIEEQIEEIKYTRQGVVPLMYQMIDGLQQLVEKDVPIKKEQRLERVEKLQSMMTRADVSDAEKYRRILEAYQIEMDYGIKLGVYQGRVALASDETIEADVLHLGRISLVARNLNGSQYWAWNQTEAQWQELDSSMKSELDKAYDIASQQAAPSLITLPVSLTVAEVK
ncbi:TonB system biopolymer transport component; Chromosome segregation ATPase [Vibrio chagasii]|nr:TonB system biopolymer transport component; Chromosome segregation ATPase [Vibrio chagasii]CAH7044480.1 TonB system biopolymer transport component; Chromosome segregation ATPase [Vibrio chagasii]CAH7090898.1 TonB system biopolymer transport component; Chromosome segregation ATPase [Vibrio chagasii]CAH7418581.1 TonB system biopolymer transport component; Chromosome segregation ATPase [Vibrio chagasii]CAH7442381.1 TonB system biopolymer transport component; Chromosome segregation ATPase [Vibri